MGHRTSKRGPRGPAGLRGRAGLKGARGAIGPAGPAGQAGAPAKGTDVLEIVEKQIEDIHQELDAQNQRIAQIQRQMDEFRAMVRRLLPLSRESNWTTPQEMIGPAGHHQAAMPIWNSTA